MPFTQPFASTGSNRSAGLQAYPNPSKGQISLTWKTGGRQPVSIRIVNSMGVEVYRALLPQNAGNTVLQLGQLPRGTYWLRFTSGDTRDIRQLVLE